MRKQFPLLAVVAAVVMTASVGSASASTSASLPRYDHVFMIVEENHAYQDIIGNPAAPTLNALAEHYGVATQYYGVTHPSGPNYVAMLGGGTFGVNSDDAYWLFGVNAPSLTDQLDAAGLAWRGYYEGMPYPGYRGYCHPVRCLGIPDSDTLYIAKHNGIVYFHGVNSNPAELQKMVPLGGLTTDLGNNRVPQFSYVIPDECHDMHGAPPVCVDSGDPGDINDNWLVSTADAFVARTVHQITNAPVWKRGNDAIVIVFDEGDDNASCCGLPSGNAGGRALAIVVTNHGPRGLQDSTPYDHYSLLATLEGTAGVGCLAAACDTANNPPMTSLFAVNPGTPAAPVPNEYLPDRAGLDANPPVGPQPAVVPGSDTPVAGPAITPGTPGTWTVAPSPNLSANDNNLAAVSAASASDVWAVGNYYTQDNPNVFRNLALHWDGTRWTALAPPNVGTQENTLFGVSALPDGQAWAAGYYADQTFRMRTLIEHEQGGQWTVVPSPNPARARDVLFAVKALGPGDVWADGYQQDTQDGTFSTLVEHWDGHQWSVVPSPNPAPNGDELFGIGASDPRHVYAVGQQLGTGFPSLALAMRWNGHRWQMLRTPHDAKRSYDPYAATTLGHELLAVGDQETDVVPQTTLSFTGHGELVPSHNATTGENDFYGVAANAATAWAAGRATDRTTDNTSPLIERLTREEWITVPAPTPAGPGGNAGLGGVTVAPDGQAWAVGAYNTSSSSNMTLIESYKPTSGGQTRVRRR
jgi:hypothetical protein